MGGSKDVLIVCNAKACHAPVSPVNGYIIVDEHSSGQIRGRHVGIFRSAASACGLQIVPNTDSRNPKAPRNMSPEVILCRNGHYLGSSLPSFYERGAPTDLFVDGSKTSVAVLNSDGGFSHVAFSVKEWKKEEDVACILLQAQPSNYGTGRIAGKASKERGKNTRKPVIGAPRDGHKIKVDWKEVTLLKKVEYPVSTTKSDVANSGSKVI